MEIVKEGSEMLLTLEDFTAIGEAAEQATLLTTPRSSAKLAFMTAKPKQATIPIVGTPVSSADEARLETAYSQFTGTAKGTPERDAARKELVDALFVNAK